MPVSRCCNCNIVEANHPIYLYGKKASNESLLNFLEKLTGYKCHLADGLPSKICRSCYNKIIKFKKFIEIFEKSTVNQRSVLRFKRCKTEADTPSGKSPATRHQRKKKAVIIPLPIKWLRRRDRGFSYLGQYYPQRKYIHVRRMRG